MSTHNIGIYNNNIFDLSSNTHLISSAVEEPGFDPKTRKV